MTSASVAKTIALAKERRELRQGITRPPPVARVIHNEEEAQQWMIDNADDRLRGKEYAMPAAFLPFEVWGRFIDPYGGRGSGKTNWTAKHLMKKVIWGGQKLLACREVMDSIQESSKAELENAIWELGAEDLVIITEKAIKARGGGKVTFIGLANTKEKVKGYADYDLCWVEEAATVSRASWKRLIPTIRKKGSQIFLTWNPNSTADDTYKRFVSECIYPEKENGKWVHIRHKINYYDNPFFNMTELAEDERFLREADPDEHAHVYLGEPVGALANAIVKPMWFKAALNLHDLVNPDYDYGHLIGGYDVGGTERGDCSSLAGQVNNVLAYLNEYREIDPVASADRAFDEGRRMEFSEIRFDTIGVGLGAKGAIRKRNASLEAQAVTTMPFLPFDASAPVVRPEDFVGPKRRNKDHYVNLKAQAWDALSKRFFHAYLFRRYWEESGGVMEYVLEKMGEERLQHMISIDTVRIAPALLDKLMGEVSAPTWIKTEGKLQVESKRDLAKRGIPSTNLADALVMAYFKMSKGVFSDGY